MVEEENIGLLSESIYKAVQTGSWTRVNEIVPKKLVGKKIALHAAASLGKLCIVKNLLRSMETVEIEDRDTDGNTALASAAITGIIEIAECLVQANQNLVTIPNLYSIQIPVTLAVGNGHIKMARYLYSVTPLETFLPENGPYGASLLNQCFLSNNLDMAFHLLQQCPRLAFKQDEQGATLVWALTGKPSMFLSGCKLQFWQRWIYNSIKIDPISAIKHIPMKVTNSNAIGSEQGLRHPLIVYIFKLIGIKRIYDSKLTHVLSLELLRLTCEGIGTLTDAAVSDSFLRAVKCGIPEFIIHVIRTKPYLLTVTDENRRDLFFIAVLFRQAKVFNLIYGYHSKNAVASSRDNKDNTLLHMAAILEPSSQVNQISGAALQMQREILWFKEVERIVQPLMREYKNKDGMTAKELFIESHKDLVKAAEESMKHTATSCTVVAVLIITIMFATSIAVPGGNDQNTGYPMFKDHKLFKLFILADSISLFFSVSSLLMFLGILTSRYAENDFVKSLPTKLTIGLSMLFISVAAMMITFCAAISLMLPGKLWIIIPVISLASLPIILFVRLLFPLLRKMSTLTYGSSIFERNMRRWI